MKIISKYKDFYDFIIQDHDADLTYVRNIGIVNDYFDDLFRKNGNVIPYFSKHGGYDTFSYRQKHGDIRFSNFIFGIYPFVFSQPILRIYYRSGATTENTFIILGRELVDKLLDSSEIISKNALENELIPLAQKEFNSKLIGASEYVNVSFSKNDKLENIQKSLKMHTWKVDCPDIFYRIESPVFVKYDNDLFVNGTYWNNWPTKPKIYKMPYTHYATDISFQKLNHNILKYWYNDLFDLNTYINIENFLWSIKHEPESNPDNKTKILAHGFDLKTSFRKM